jgi:hypothetical protein
VFKSFKRLITKLYEDYDEKLQNIHIPENCSAYVPMILKEFCSSKINGLVMKTFSGK